MNVSAAIQELRDERARLTNVIEAIEALSRPMTSDGVKILHHRYITTPERRASLEQERQERVPKYRWTPERRAKFMATMRRKYRQGK